MFQFPGFAHHGNRGVAGSLPPGFPIRTSAGRRAFAPRRGFSQLVTSFVASESHRHPPCALSVFPCVFKSAASARIAPRRHALSSLLDLLNLSRSIALSTRFLRFDFKTLARRTSNGPLRANGATRASLLFTLRVPNMSMTSYLFLSVVPGRLELPTSTLSV